MPTRDIRTRLSLDGEITYKQALSEMSKGLSVLNSELRLNAEQYKGNEDSIEALTSKGEILEQKLLSQRDKVDLLRQAYEKSAQQNGESSTKTQDLRIKLNDAEKALISMDRELKTNASSLEESTKKNIHFNDALDGGQQSAKGLGDIVGDLSGKLGINLPQGMTDSLNGMVSLSGGMAMAAAGAAALVVVLIEVAKAAGEMVVAQAAAADEIVTLSMQTGIAIETLQALKYAEELVDVSTDTVTKTMAKNIRSMDDSRKGNKELADAYRELGVRVTGVGGQLRDGEAVYWDVIDALGKMKNETERDAIAMTLLGRSAQELNPLIKIGSAGMAEYTKRAEAAGAVNEEMALSLANVDDSVQYFNANLEAAKNTLSASLAPAMSNFIDEGNDLIGIIADVVEESGLDDFMSVLIEAGVSILRVLEPLMEILGPIVGETLKPVALALGLVADALTIIASILGIIIESIKWLVGMSPNAADKIAGYWSNVSGVFSGSGATSAALKMYNIGNNAEGTSNWRGGLTWVGESGPELVNLPTGSAVYSNRQSMAMAGNVTVIIDAKNVKEFNDVVKVAQNARITQRAGYAGRR